MGFGNYGRTNYICMIGVVNYGCRKTDGYVEMIIWYLAYSTGVPIISMKISSHTKLNFGGVSPNKSDNTSMDCTHILDSYLGEK